METDADKVMDTRTIAQGGLFAGASIVLLCLASILGVASYCAAMLAGFIPAVFFLKGKPMVGRMVYSATAILSVLVVPDKEVAIVYSLFFGLYTVLKYEIERLHRLPLELFLKFFCAIVWAVATVGLIRFGFLPEIANPSTKIMVFVFVGWIAFLAYYDFCLSCIFAGMAKTLNKFHF